MNMTVTQSDFGFAAGRTAKLYTLSSGGYSASICDLGCTLVSFSPPGGRSVVLSYGSAEDYLAGSSSLGATVGRYAGRIAGASFTLDGKRYELSRNDGENHLHGGFGKRYFTVREGLDGLEFTLVSPSGDEGFPGRLTLTVTVTLDGGKLRFAYRARTTKPTHVNVTCHAYFNLGGGDVSDHLLTVFAGRYFELGPGCIPTGHSRNACGTRLRFSSPTELSRALRAPELAGTRGLDHSFALPGWDTRRTGVMRGMGVLSCPAAGLTLVCRSTQPTLHVYTAGFLDEDANAGAIRGTTTLVNGAVCLEPQHLPNTPNCPRFPSTRLDPGSTFSEIIEYELIPTAKE